MILVYSFIYWWCSESNLAMERAMDKQQIKWYSARPEIRLLFCAEGTGSVFTAPGRGTLCDIRL